jgi:hypothetical protein
MLKLPWITNLEPRHKHAGGNDVEMHEFLISILFRCEWSVSFPGLFNPGSPTQVPIG